MDKTILVLGAGTGGIIAAKELSKRVKGKARILLFEKEVKNVFAPSLLWLMVGKRKPEQIYRNTQKIAAPGLEVIIGNIEKINPEQISVLVNDREYHGDYMVVSLGTEQFADYNLNRYGCDFYTLDGAAKFNEQLLEFKGGRIAVLVSSLPFKCPAAPYEAAMLIEDFIRKKGLCDKTELLLYVPEPGPMRVAGIGLSNAVR